MCITAKMLVDILKIIQLVLIQGMYKELSNYLAECLVHFCESHFESILHRLSSVAGYIDSIHHEIATSVLPFVLFRQMKSNLIMLKAQYSAEVEMC